jgi:Do/DeqQ family serine protease
LKINNKHILLQIIISALVAIAAIAMYHWIFSEVGYRSEKYKSHVVSEAEKEVLFSDRFYKAFRSPEPNNFMTAAEASIKAVVFIKSNGTSTNSSSTKNPGSTGSGVILSSDGYIVTNQHVISGASKIDVTLYDNRVFKASLIGEDLSTDLALLKIESENLNFLVFGNSDSLRIGEWVMAVGNPFRLQSTVTAGIVSAKARNINILEKQGIESFIQTDAAVNPGNSGGALINTNGDLVGICTAIVSENGRYEGFSFAVPANLARKVVADLKNYGVVQRGWLNIDIENIDQNTANELGLDEVSGVLIAYVSKNGGAFDAGLKSHDVIISVNNNKVNNTSEFMELLGQFKPGDKLALVYVRNGKKAVTTATLRNQINTTDLIGIREDAVFKAIGITARDLDTYEKAIYTSEGALVISVKNGSIMSRTKMEPGYIVTKINNHKVHNVSTLIQFLETYKGKTIILEGFYPAYSGEYPYTFKMP